MDTTSHLKTIGLERLSEIAQSLSQENAQYALLSLCFSEDLRVYFPVPAGHVVAVHETALVERRMGYPATRPVIRYRGRAAVRHEVKWICVDKSSLKQIRDANYVVLEDHFEGGLVDATDGYTYKPLDLCVVRRDSPTFAPTYPVFRPEMLTEGVVFPTRHEIRFSDLSVARDDAALLRKAVGPSEIHDRWGHKESAPNVYRMYALSQEPYNEAEFVRHLIAMDDSGVFIKQVAITAARILKKEVRARAEKGLLVEKISNNEMEKDYYDPELSKRMSLLLLATDCWLHDQALHEESEQLLRPARESVALAKEGPTSTDALKKMEKKFLAAHMSERRQLSCKLYMPKGLEDYLRALGFSSNQAPQLARVIRGKKVGGVHQRTKKALAIKR